MAAFFPVPCSLFAFPRADFIFDLIATHDQGSWGSVALALANFVSRINEQKYSVALQLRAQVVASVPVIPRLLADLRSGTKQSLLTFALGSCFPRHITNVLPRYFE